MQEVVSNLIGAVFIAMHLEDQPTVQDLGSLELLQLHICWVE